MGIEYSVSVKDGKVKCVARNQAKKVDYYWNGDFSGVVFVEATATLGAIQSNAEVRGLLVQYENVVVHNPAYDINRHAASWKDMVERKEVKRKENTLLPDDMVAFMRHQLAIQENRDVTNRAYLDKLFN